MARKKQPSKPVVACPACGRISEPDAGPLNFCPECGSDMRGGAGGRAGTHALLDRVIADRYRLLSLLGEGGMGAVYKAEHIRMGKALALKILRGDFAAEAGAVERFRAEAQIVSRLSHPNTIAVFDFGEIEDGSGFYLAMEYVPGKDLSAVLREEGRIPEMRAAWIGQQILGSLAEAHDAGIVHRDMKPGNVMLAKARTGEDFVKVLDFGIAKLRDESPAASTATSTTSAGAIVGTPNYLAPEQARGEPLDARADLYAVGCLLYELVAGRPPFQAPTPMAVVSAHLQQPPPPLGDLAPGLSRRFVELVHRAIEKRPQDRFASADEMRDALLGIGEPTGTRPLRKPPTARITGELEIASREDFREFERQFRALRRSRMAAPLLLLGLAVAVAAAIWRWDDLYALLVARAPAVAARLPEEVRPSGHYDGEEHEPNDLPARANRLPVPPGTDGRPAGGVARIRGTVGAKLSDDTGDVDIYRLEVPPGLGRKVLAAEWRGERPGEGIRGLDVSLALNRERVESDARTSAPLVASVNRGGAGRPESLLAAVEGGVYYLAVREQHDAATGPVEKPTDRYVLEVRLEDPKAGEEIEPNDSPERTSARFERYPEWSALAARNPLGEAGTLKGDTSPDDPDLFAVEPRGAGEAPAVVVAVPDPGLALRALLWVPDAEDLAPRAQDRVRFEAAGEAAPGRVLVVKLPPAPRAGAPVLLQLRAAEGAGRYELLALGPGSASGALALSTVRALSEAGRPAAALELAAAYARQIPRAASRDEALVAAGRIAEERAPSLAADGLAEFERASQLLGAAVFAIEGGKASYRGAFEAAVEGEGRAADEAALRLVVLGARCAPEEVAIRAAAYLERKPAPPPELAAEARLLHARALEEAFWAAGGKDRGRLDAALGAWKALASRKDAAGGEAAPRVAALSGKEPSREGARQVCR